MKFGSKSDFNWSNNSKIPAKKMIKLVNNLTKFSLSIRTIAFILAINISLIVAQIDFFHNNKPNRQPWNLSPSARCKWHFHEFLCKFNKIFENFNFFSIKWKNKILLVLSLFTIYQWNNGLCSATSGEYGMCLPELECSQRRGILGGPCAQGYGICCICK